MSSGARSSYVNTQGHCFAALPRRHQEELQSYADGVNAGLADLGARPPEYLLMRQQPAPWLPEDSMLVVLALYTMLSNNDSYERHNGALREFLPPEVRDFVTPMTARDDRPLTAREDDDPTGGYEPRGNSRRRCRRPAQHCVRVIQRYRATAACSERLQQLGRCRRHCRTRSARGK